MDKLTFLLAFLKAHWGYISAATVLVVTALANHKVGNPAVQTLWTVILDVLAPKVQAGAAARLAFTTRSLKTPLGIKLPFLMRSHHGNPTVKTAAGAITSLLFLIPLLMVSSCGTAGGQALGKCELNALPQVLQTGEACILQAASGQGDAQAALTACAIGLAPGQFSCLVQAVLAWAKKSIPPAGQALPETIRLVTNLQVYLNAHPTKAACDPYVASLAVEQVSPLRAAASLMP